MMMTHSAFLTSAPDQFTRQFTLTAPVNGGLIDIEALNAPLFVARMWGPALAFKYSGHTLFAPSDCLIESIPETGYELSIRTPYGLKIWINLLPVHHQLMGEKCERLVKTGQKVKAGTPLMRFQPQWLRQQGLETYGVICLRNGDKCKGLLINPQSQFLAVEDPLVSVYL